MTRIITTILALVPGLATVGLAYWFFARTSPLPSATPKPMPSTEIAIEPPAEQAVPEASPPAPIAGSLYAAEARLATLREALQELNDPSGENVAGRIAAIEGEIEMLSSSRAAVESRLEEVDSQILEAQTGLAPNAPAPGQLDALKEIRTQLEAQKTAARTPDDLDPELTGELNDPRLIAERLDELREELRYWRERGQKPDDPEPRVRRQARLEDLIRTQTAKVESLREAPLDHESVTE